MYTLVVGDNQQVIEMIAIYLILFFVYLGNVASQTQIGGSCYHKGMNKHGSCQLLTNCRPSMYELITYRVYPQSCGTFVGKVQVVCCTSGNDDFGYISKDRCEAYSELAYKWEDPVVLVPGAQRTKKYLCTFDAKPMIVGGEKATAKEFPHMAALGIRRGNNTEWSCGGSLISEQYILTAAHCITVDFRLDGIIRLGDLVLGRTDDDANVHEYKVSSCQITKHHMYHRPEHYFDIALVKLTKPVRFSEYIRPICLYTETAIREKRALASGWGQTEDYTSSDELRKVILDLFSYDLCKSKYATQTRRRMKRGLLDDSQICAGSLTSNRDTCYGDSGGPLQIYNADYQCMYYLIGVTSYGVDCGTQIPGVYTRVSKFITWIEDTVWLEKAQPKSSAQDEGRRRNEL